MSMIHFVGGEKGGVGKSVVSRLLSQYFLDNSLHYVGLDADQSHPTLTRYYQDFTQALNLDVFASTDEIMELALAGERNVLIDLPAQSQRFLDHWIEENGVLEMCKDMGVNLVYWYVVDDGQDSVQLLEKFLAKYNSHLHSVVVKNQGRGHDFSALENLPIVQQSLQQISLPALHADTMRKIDKLNFSFWAAMNVKDNPQGHLGLMERQRTKVWMKRVYAAFDSVFNEL